jgi:hypothetical protein
MADKIVTVSVLAGNRLQVLPDPVPCEPRPHGRDIDIQWTIDTLGWKFTSSGIEFKDTNDGTFHTAHPGNTEFHWLNKHHHERRYHYTVNVISTDNKTSLTLDPAIENHGDSDVDT